MSNNVFSTLVDKDILTQVSNLYNEMDYYHELEYMIYNFNKKELSMVRYITLLKYLTSRTKVKDSKVFLQQIDDFDINYVDNLGITYRITLSGIENINKNIEKFHTYKNHVMFKIFLEQQRKGNKEISVMKKIKDKEKTIDMSDIYIRARLSEEINLTKEDYENLSNLSYKDINNIVVRMKNRTSFYVYGKPGDKTFIKIDITITKTTKNINKINNIVPRYEVEIELGIANKKDKTDKLFEQFNKEASLLLKVIQQTNNIITNSKEQEIVKQYTDLSGLDYNKTTTLDGRKPISLEISHVTEILPNKYSVTDKADGERYFLIIYNNHIYLISSNLDVKDTGIIISEELSKYNNTILDGEYIFISKKNRYLYMVFDCLYYCNKNVKNIEKFMDRIKLADDVINNCFIIGSQKGFEIKEYENKNSEFDLANILKFHDKQIKEFYNGLNNDIDLEKKFVLVRRKYFLGCFGAVSWEIFSYAVLLWNKYSNDSTVKFPYTLDGLIFQPLIQSYVSAKDSILFEYKWKPPEKNSIDFYITIQKDKITKKELVIYDNSQNEIDKEITRNISYKILYLHVGSRGKYGEEPMLFRENEGRHTNHIALTINDIVDVEGNLLSDGTVVEFYYDTNPEINDLFRWIPLRTRYDKTENVLKYKTQYGNFTTTANGVWRSIINPILMSDFEDLAKGNNEKKGEYAFDKKNISLRNRIDKAQVLSASREQSYFQVRTELTKKMRGFHNWIKSTLMYTYNSTLYRDGKNVSVWDIGFGKGQDVNRYYYSVVKILVATDIDYISLISATDGAKSRYENTKKSKVAVPDMFFIQADGGALMNSEDQSKALKGMTKENKDLMDKFFSKDKGKRTFFDRINCQFAMHYFLKNQETWDNFKTNLKDYLKPGGYYLGSTYDAKRIIELFKETDTYTTYYTDNKGEKKKLFEIVNKFGKLDPNSEIGIGHAVDFFAAWLFLEGTYVTEYLVDINFLKRELLEFCDLELVDTDYFDNLMIIHRDFILNYTKYEFEPLTNKFLTGVGEYYNNKDPVNQASYLNTRLYRYFVFRKKSNSKQVGGNKFVLDKNFIIEKNKNKQKTFCDSIFNIFQKHSIVPSSLNCKKFLNEMGFDMLSDNKINKEYINNFSNNIIIYHDMENSIKKKVLDGLSIVIIEQNCNDEYEYDFYIKNKYHNKDKIILLLLKDNVYSSIYRIEDNSKRGMFNMDDLMISDLLKMNID
jgi:hypothetical protein